MLNYISSSEEFKSGQLAFIRRSLKVKRGNEIRASCPASGEHFRIEVKPKISPEVISESEQRSPSEPQKLMEYEDAWEFYTSNQNLSKETELVREDIKTVRESQKTCCLIACFGKRIPTLEDKEQEELERILAVAKKGHDATKGMNNKVLLSIYQKLFRNQEPDFAAVNWEELGFQNNKNPYTDLRALGMLGILNIMYLVESYEEVVRTIHRASLDEKHGFPFVLISFDMTKTTIQALREGILNSIIKEKQSVSKTFNIFYASTFFYWFLEWRTKGLEMKDYFFSNKRISEEAKADPIKQIGRLPGLIKSIPCAL